ncbi:tRNA pseudouridine(38-40) synthase TruA [Alphaproteobacteria bacterium]|nr:tRNA pseudouridine(38-40) synthase TruA [Alphaproteobacteria bacterium]
MNNIKLTIEYHGLPYCGWQYQKNEKTVQGEIEKAIFKFSGEKKTIQGAGRTDAGVHAIGQCANFELEKQFDDYQILNGINFHLGTEKIRITKVENVDQEFNARFTAKSKIYNYQVFNSQAPSVIEDDFSIHIRQPLDLDAMQNAIKLFLGKHDFSSFRAQGCQASKPIRTVDDASIVVKGKKIIFVFKAQSFLYQQIRIMVGSLLEVGMKNKSINWIKDLIEAKDRKLAGPTVPSKGLILKEISY